MKIVNLTGSRARRLQAFTMIEIAISLAVIAFALVAIIGILPTGLTAQKGNREETIINQEGPYFLEVIKSGGQGFDHLLNNIDKIGIVTKNTNTLALSTNFAFYSGLIPAGYSSNMVGLLSLRKGTPFSPAGGDPVEMVIATVRALSGAAVETGGASQDFAFGYQLTAEVVPLQWEADAPFIADVVASDLAPEHKDRYLGTLKNHLFELRITCRWPLLPGDRPGPNRKTFRSLISGRMNTTDTAPRHFFETQNFNIP